jgi:hypothetical protein
MIRENEFPFNFAHLLDSVAALNIHHGEGQAITVNINGKGRLMTPPNIHLAVYSNGFILEEGAFRPYSDPLSRLFMKSLVNGQFPDELRESHPNGVPIQLFDRHEDAFVDSSYPMWQGKGIAAVREEEGEADSESSNSEDIESEQDELEKHLAAQAPIPTWNPMSSVLPQKERAVSAAPHESPPSRIATMTSKPRRMPSYPF